MFTAGCGGGPSSPTPPPDGPRLSCPADQTIRTTARTATVTYPLATVTGGVAPVSVVCTPPSGASFPAGRTTTTCVGTDAQQRTDICTFNVTVEAIPLVGATRYVAFGDSITEGKLSTGEPPPVPYPADLMSRLAARYSTQQFTVQNAGNGAETSSGGVSRLPGVLSAGNPEVLLLMEGVNDLAGDDASRIPPLINNLRTMVQQARSRGMVVFLGTLLPETPGGSRTGARLLIVPANDQIRALAPSAGATLVDLYQAFSGMETTLLGSDGLHPTIAGYSVIAQTFFDAIRARLEVSPSPTLTLNATGSSFRVH